MKFNPDIHYRRSIRLKGYDYSREGLYFVTLICRKRRHIFGEIQNGVMCLNLFGSIAYQTWLNTPQIRPNIGLGAFTIMPNHLHGIIEIKQKIQNKNRERIGKFRSPSQTVGAIVRGYKGSVTKQIKQYIFEQENSREKKDGGKGELQFAPTVAATPTDLIDLYQSIWQRDYYEHIIRNEKSFQYITNYINENPLRWDEDRFNTPPL